MKSLYSASACAKPCVAALAEPAIGHQQLGLGQIFAGVVGVHQRLQRKPRTLVPAVFDVVHGAVEQHLVGLLRVLGDGVFVLLFAASHGDHQHRHHGGYTRVTNCVSNHHQNSIPTSIPNFFSGSTLNKAAFAS